MNVIVEMVKGGEGIRIWRISSVKDVLFVVNELHTAIEEVSEKGMFVDVKIRRDYSNGLGEN